MDRVGIITRYFNNFNYGGLLQSYALQQFIQSMGFDVKQISFTFTKSRGSLYINTAIKNIIKSLFFHEYSRHVRRWRTGLKAFERTIPHTEQIYSNKNIKDCVKEFDIFICGSDQIWNLDFSNLYYYALGFVPDNKKKISYSASIGKSRLDKNEKAQMYPYLKRLDYISLRETQLQAEISKDIQKEVEVVCDPAMLLNRKQWDKIKKPSDLKNYIFVYLLGDDENQRRLATQFAKKKELQIVFIPYTLRLFRLKKISQFGDIQPDNIDPAGFIGLIENAEYVITDSFHASVFSILYHTDFYVFERKGGEGDENMGSRLHTLLDKMLLKDRLLPDDVTLEEMLSADSISEAKWETVDKEVEAYREKSICFLKKALCS